MHVLGRSREAAERQAQRALPSEPVARGGNARAYLGSLAFVAVALGVGLVLRQALGVASIALTFLTAVLVSAVAYGLWPALFACFVSVLAYNFFFLPPLYTFTIADPENVVALFFFAITAVIASNLTARVRAQAITARQRARTTEELYQFSRKLAGAANLDDLLWATVHQIALMLKVRVVILLPEDDSVAVRAGFPPEDSLDAADVAAARWCWDKNHAAGRGADTLPGAKRLFLPMQTGRGAVGVIGIDRDEPGPILTPDQQRLLNALADQAALAIERVNLVEDVDRARLVAETDRLRAALLTSISHDLRTPLASILGSATSLATQDEALDRATRLDLIRTIQEESERLNRFIGNLLDMTRIEFGSMKPRTGPIELSDVIGSALRRAGKILAAHRTQIRLEPDLPMLDLDDVLFEQVLFNLLDNAAKYAPAGSLVTISGVAAEWPGLPAGDRRGARNTACRSGASVRQVLPRGRCRPPPRRNRPRTCNLPRLCRGDARDHNGRQSHRSNRGGVHHYAAGSGQRRTAGRGYSVTEGAGPLRVLVVDDEPAILRFLRAGLGSQGYVVLEAENGQKALDAVRSKRADIMVLDLGLPDIDGLEVIKRVRDAGSAVPIIVLSSRNDEAAKVQALDCGADDYVTKPFGIEELLARIRAAQRHRLQQQGEKPIFRTGDLTVDLVRRIVTVRGKEVKFSPREYDLLRLLVAHAGKVLTHNMILREVWDPQTDVQYLRIYIRALRQKIESDTEKPEYIMTETGVGYRLRGARLMTDQATS